MGASSTKEVAVGDDSLVCAGARSKVREGANVAMEETLATTKYLSKSATFAMGAPPGVEMPVGTTEAKENPKNNILLMTDGYKFSHHKQYPVSWMPEHARPKTTEGIPPVLFPHSGVSQGSTILRLQPVPGVGVPKITIVTNVSTAVVEVEPADDAAEPDIIFAGSSATYTGARKERVVMELSPKQHAALGLPAEFKKLSFINVDESKLKRGSALNDTYEGGYNVSYFTPRAYKDAFESCADDGSGDHIVFFGLQYFIKEYLEGKVVTNDKIVRPSHPQMAGAPLAPRPSSHAPPDLRATHRLLRRCTVLRCPIASCGLLLLRAAFILLTIDHMCMLR